MTQAAGVNDRPDTTLRGWWLPGARIVWLAVVVLILMLWSLGITTLARDPLPDCAEVVCDPVDFNVADVELAQELGLPSGPFRPPFSATLATLTGVMFFGIAALIFWRRSYDWMGLLVSFVLVFLGGVFFTSADDAVDRTYVQLVPVASVVRVIGLTGLISLFFLFPDGRFVPRWTRWATIVVVAGVIAGEIVLSSVDFGAIRGVAIVVGVVVGVAAQVHRYRRVSEAAERQQTKWVVVGLIGAIGIMLVWAFVAVAFPPEEPSKARVYALLVAEPVILLLLFFLPVSLAVSILRYRLWDIDLIVSRTLVYATLTATLAAVYVGTVIGLQTAFRATTGQSSDLAIVISTLVIAALFIPLRGSIQRVIDRRFYRRRYDAAITLAAFADRMRDEVDVDRLTDELVAVVKGTMQPVHASLWLRAGSRNGGRNDPETIAD